MAIGKEITELEAVIGYKFSDITYLENAVTHASYSNEQKNRGINLPSNERLEFLGDAVLQLIISEYLYANFPKYKEGALTKMRQSLVCEKNLSKIAEDVSLGDYINLGRGEEAMECRTRPKVLADALEALIAAIYIDSKGIDECRYVVLGLMKDEIDTVAGTRRGDYKTLLQQLVEADGAAILEYTVIGEDGPEHDRTFTVAAYVNGNEVGRGAAKNKKNAEMQAAKQALSLFGLDS